MLSYIGSALTAIWKKMGRKKYRDAFVTAHISNTVASQIALLRNKHGWTQKELAEKAGMKQSRISALEDPNYENIEVGTLRRLASAFDVGLTVRFVPFSELVRWSATLSDADISVSSFDEDTLTSPVGATAVDYSQKVLGTVAQTTAVPLPPSSIVMLN